MDIGEITGEYLEPAILLQTYIFVKYWVLGIEEFSIDQKFRPKFAFIQFIYYCAYTAARVRNLNSVNTVSIS